jgi:hypothetical protein
MGLRLFGSGCGCNTCNSSRNDLSPLNFSVEPDPKNFKVLESYQYKHAHVLVVEYPNCTNYEGKKILVRRGEYILPEDFIDPHFCDNTRLLIARFEPSPMGLVLAKQLAEDY